MKQFCIALEDDGNIFKNFVPCIFAVFITVFLHHFDVKKVELSVTAVSQLGSSLISVKAFVAT